MNCATCKHFWAGFCRKLHAEVEPDYVCEEWEERE